MNIGFSADFGCRFKKNTSASTIEHHCMLPGYGIAGAAEGGVSHAD